MSLHELTKLATRTYDRCRKLVAQGEEVLPHVLYRLPTGARGVIVMRDYGDPELKSAHIAKLRVDLRRMGVTDYVFAFEAWVTVASKPGELFEGMPRDNPNREEWISIVGGDREGAVHGWSAKIKTTSGKRSLTPLEKLDYVIEGAGAALLYDKDAH